MRSVEAVRSDARNSCRRDPDNVAQICIEAAYDLSEDVCTAFDRLRRPRPRPRPRRSSAS